MTLPAEVREALQVEAGDIVEFEIIGIVRRRDATSFPTESHPILERRPTA